MRTSQFLAFVGVLNVCSGIGVDPISNVFQSRPLNRCTEVRIVMRECVRLSHCMISLILSQLIQRSRARSRRPLFSFFLLRLNLANVLTPVVLALENGR